MPRCWNECCTDKYQKRDSLTICHECAIVRGLMYCLCGREKDMNKHLTVKQIRTAVSHFGEKYEDDPHYGVLEEAANRLINLIELPAGIVIEIEGDGKWSYTTAPKYPFTSTEGMDALLKRS